MIVSVTGDNEQVWAALCVALWPDECAENLLEQRARGELPNEFLYLIGDQAVAFLSLSLRHDYVEGTDSSPVGYLEGIYVKPEYRGRGIARDLVEYAKRWARERRCSQLASDCEVGNELGETFHKRTGFQEANRIICFTLDLHTR